MSSPAGQRFDLTVVGLGYVGLPLAQAAAAAGLRVAGLDRSERVVSGLAAGRSHVDDLSAADITAMLDAGFTPTTDAAVIAASDVAVICVPTPLSPDGGPDLAAVTAAAAAVGGHVHPGLLVVLESTTYPGTTEEIVQPLLETGGLRAGVDFDLAFSPERIDPGNPVYGMVNTPKVVGGIDARSTARAAGFYGRFVDRVVVARGTREAEMAKLLENTYRHVNIALVNEMARFCHELGIDLWDAISCAATKPFGFQAFRPGPGVGGHCIPIDPNYLSHLVRSELGYPFRFVELAQEINAGMPDYVRDRVRALLAATGGSLDGARVLLLGVTYKADIADQRESPAVPLARALIGSGARLSYHDPQVPVWDVGGAHLDRVPDLWAALDAAEVAVLVQAHSAYDLAAIAARARLLLDTRGVVPAGPGVQRL